MLNGTCLFSDSSFSKKPISGFCNPPQVGVYFLRRFNRSRKAFFHQWRRRSPLLIYVSCLCLAMFKVCV